MKSTAFRNPATWAKIVVFLVWLLLFGLLLKREVFIKTLDVKEASLVEQAAREDYQGIYFKGKKIGFVANLYRPHADRTVTVEQRARMTLNVAGTANTITMQLTAQTEFDGRLREFTFSFRSPLYQMQADGRVNGNTVAFTLLTGSATIRDSLRLNSPPLLSTSRRGYLLQEGIEVGRKFKIPSFDPISLTGHDSVIEYQGKERTSIQGRVENLHHFFETFSGTRVNFWLDDAGEVVKEESPAGFVFLREPKFKAMEGNEEGPELLSSVSIKVIGTMPNLAGLPRLRYRLHFPDDGSFHLNSGRQTFADDVLTVHLESWDAPRGDVPCRSDSADLAATPYVQANHPKIRKAAAEITAGMTGDPERVRALAEYVNQYLEKRPVLGVPDALTVFESRKGDCNEHAVLFAALARAAGIPCRIAAGVVYFRDAFYYHAWNEVCVNGRWVSLDTTTNQLPADLSHIKFVEGEIRQQMRIGALLGRLSIEPLPDAEGLPSAETQLAEPTTSAPPPTAVSRKKEPSP